MWFDIVCVYMCRSSIKYMGRHGIALWARVLGHSWPIQLAIFSTFQWRRNSAFCYLKPKLGELCRLTFFFFFLTFVFGWDDFYRVKKKKKKEVKFMSYLHFLSLKCRMKIWIYSRILLLFFLGIYIYVYIYLLNFMELLIIK